MKRLAITATGLIFLFVTSAFIQPSKWEYLGKRTVNKTFDRDEIVVTGAKGTFNALKFKVKHRAITLYDMKVHYGNGSVEDIKIRLNIKAGGESRVIDLKGKNRIIKKVVFKYETKPIKGKKAVIHLAGRH